MEDLQVISRSGFFYHELIVWELLKAKVLYGATFDDGFLGARIFFDLQKKKPSLFTSPFPKPPSMMSITVSVN